MRSYFLLSALMLAASPVVAKEFKYTADKNPPFTSFLQRYDSQEQPQVTAKGKLTGDVLQEINDKINGEFFYREETDLFIPGGYWQTPAETKALNNGDCEDYAVMKWHALLAYGVPEKDMVFMLGAHKTLRTASGSPMMHAILKVNLEGKPYYLDNTTWYMEKPMIDTDKTVSYINRFGYVINAPEIK